MMLPRVKKHLRNHTLFLPSFVSFHLQKYHVAIIHDTKTVLSPTTLPKGYVQLFTMKTIASVEPPHGAHLCTLRTNSLAQPAVGGNARRGHNTQKAIVPFF